MFLAKISHLRENSFQNRENIILYREEDGKIVTVESKSNT